MNTLHKLFHTHKLVLAAAVIIGLGAVSCEKGDDFSRPAGNTNSIEKDKADAFKNLTDDETSMWAWAMETSFTNNKFPGMLLQLSKDSSANIYSIDNGGIVTDLSRLRSSGTLTAGESSLALQLINILRPYSDYQIRQILADPQNASFKNAVLSLLPNYENFGSQTINLRELEGAFDANGPIQLSLTFHNSEFLALLKEYGWLDFDFRLLRYTKDTVELTGYYSNSANKVSYLLRTHDDPTFFAYASTIMMTINPSKAKVTMKTGGNVVPIPAGYNSGLHYFYKCFNQGFLQPDGLGYGFVPNGVDVAKAPDVFKNAKLVKIKSVRQGNPLTAPAGTVLMTFTVIGQDGTSKEVELSKN
ncbi:hypothetical protein SAMN05444266_103251 [Chitinophaga jiangningensis]|uniref:Uncharacterized protein n=1 Tax=Chitinophaga jiangningensis TaxID=1419482 RepID=A0A1M7AEN1_9BACT|nr:hypothetical protein [Chitinophaga jiangningensis]SHL41221.1 hypothetical protein SAMN05444266_103251 [Chitinophaga jiangningensis]